MFGYWQQWDFECGWVPSTTPQILLTDVIPNPRVARARARPDLNGCETAVRDLLLSKGRLKIARRVPHVSPPLRDVGPHRKTALKGNLLFMAYAAAKNRSPEFSLGACRYQTLLAEHFYDKPITRIVKHPQKCRVTRGGQGGRTLVAAKTLDCSANSVQYPLAVPS